MRQLSLNEKISIKGKLERFGIPPKTMVALDMGSALFLWNRCHRHSIAYWHL